MTKLINTTVFAIITATTVFAATAYGNSFDQRIDFPALTQIQADYLSQQADHQHTVRSTAQLFEDVTAIQAITDSVERAAALAALEARLATHINALQQARLRIERLFGETQSKFLKDAIMLRNAAPVSQEEAEIQRDSIGVIKRTHEDSVKHGDIYTEATLGLARDLNLQRIEKMAVAKYLEAISTSGMEMTNTSSGMSVNTVRIFLDALAANHNRIKHHAHITGLLHTFVQYEHVALNTKIINDTVIGATVVDPERLPRIIQDGMPLSPDRRDGIPIDDIFRSQ